MVTINTDDPAMFEASLSREYQLVQENFGQRRALGTGPQFLRSRFLAGGEEAPTDMFDAAVASTWPT
jgi:hypothetical protein